MKKKIVMAVGAILSMLLATGVSAQTTLDPQIYVCQTCNAPSGGLLIGMEGNPITDPTGFNMGVEAGNHTLLSPLLVILGVPDWTTAMGLPGLTYFNGTTDVNESLATGSPYGITANQAAYTSGDAYTNLGVTGSASVSFGNLVSTESQNGLGTPTSFEEFVYDIPISLTSATSPITLDTGAPNGTFVIGYSCEDSTCSPPGAIGRTPNTNVGFVDSTPVPEPASLLLFGSGLIVLGLVTRRRRRSTDGVFA